MLINCNKNFRKAAYIPIAKARGITPQQGKGKGKMQRISFIGNLVRDPENSVTPKGITKCTFTVAVDRKYKVDGEKQTDFFRINAWRNLGEVCGRCLTKGKKVAVVGELHPRLYEDKTGKTRLSLDVEADEVEFLSPKDETKPKREKENSDGYDNPADLAGFTDIRSDDLPF